VTLSTLRPLSRPLRTTEPLLALVAACALVFAAGGHVRGASWTLVGAGDIAVCGSSADEATAALLDAIPGTVFTTGDNVYSSGTATEFADCYGPGWGRHLGRTRPSPGNHDYATGSASGYFGYFGSRAGPAGRGYYAYSLGGWRIYSLNSERMTGSQLEWLRADLGARSARCSLAYWHRPLFSSGMHGDHPGVRPFWRALYRAGAELVINGHEHEYERFAKLRPDGTRARKGLRQIIVGTGGASLREFGSIRPHSVVRDAGSHGVLKLTLAASGYSWQFIGIAGDTRDAGSGVCHSKP
jgi:hypothetical protein